MNYPLLVKSHEYGVQNLNFKIHEQALNRFAEPPASWSEAILALLDETAQRSDRLVLLVRLIDEAPRPRSNGRTAARKPKPGSRKTATTSPTRTKPS